MKGFNLSEWAINHRSFVWYFMLLFVVAGVLSYVELGREEDPSFSIKTMLVQTYWPGANIDDIMEWFDGLDREQVKAVIEFAARSLDKAPEYAPAPTP